MRKVLALALLGVSLAAAAPAFAGQARRHVDTCRNVSAWDQQCSRVQRADPYNVYSYDGRLIGRDPDPNIRRSLQDEDAYYRNGRW